MVVPEDKMTTADEENYNAIGNFISQNVFANAPVNVALTDDHFKTAHTVHFVPMDMTEDAGREENEIAMDTIPLPKSK